MSIKDKLHIDNPEEWRWGNVCPLVKDNPDGGFPNIGVIYREIPRPNGTVTVVKNANIFNDKSEMQTLERETFESTDKLLEAGWRVD